MSKKENQLSLLDLGNFGHGGRREGAGRKKSTKKSVKTLVMRVPEPLAEEFREKIKKFREEQGEK